MSKIFMRFPGGRVKTLTLSYDDGVEQDIRLIEIMKAHGLKGTFNINSELYAPEGKIWPEGHVHRIMSRSQAFQTYSQSGMEVAVHTATHPFLDHLPVNLCTSEILRDRENLEKEYGVIVRGSAYPYGAHNDSVVAALTQCGIVYARTTKSTERFELPADWLRLPATCHHRNPRLMELAKEFVESTDKRTPKLFYLWGHSYEFEQMNNWHVIEEFAEYVGNREDIWYATNIEIYDYIAAYNQLVFSMDRKKVYNPTATELFFKIDKENFSVRPGETFEMP